MHQIGVSRLYSWHDSEQVLTDCLLVLVLPGLVNIRLTEHKVNEKEVLANLVKVNVAKKQVEVRLGKTEFGKRKEKRQINKKKKKILEDSWSWIGGIVF